MPHFGAGRGVVEHPLPPVEHRLGALGRRGGAGILGGRVVVIAHGQEVQVEVGRVRGEPAARLLAALRPVVADPGERGRLGEQVAEFGGSVRLAPCRQREPAGEQQRLERALVGPADVAQRAEIERAQVRGRARAQSVKAGAERLVLVCLLYTSDAADE